MACCYHCGTETEPGKAITLLVVESSTGRLGLGHLHWRCTDSGLARHRQVVEWDGSTIGDLPAFKRLHGQVAAMNKASWGSVPIVLASGGTGSGAENPKLTPAERRELERRTLGGGAVSKTQVEALLRDIRSSLK